MLEEGGTEIKGKMGKRRRKKLKIIKYGNKRGVGEKKKENELA